MFRKNQKLCGCGRIVGIKGRCKKCSIRYARECKRNVPEVVHIPNVICSALCTKQEDAMFDVVTPSPCIDNNSIETCDEWIYDNEKFVTDHKAWLYECYGRCEVASEKKPVFSCYEMSVDVHRRQEDYVRDFELYDSLRMPIGWHDDNGDPTDRLSQRETMNSSTKSIVSDEPSDIFRGMLFENENSLGDGGCFGVECEENSSEISDRENILNGDAVCMEDSVSSVDGMSVDGGEIGGIDGNGASMGSNTVGSTDGDSTSMGSHEVEEEEIDYEKSVREELSKGDGRYHCRNCHRSNFTDCEVVEYNVELVSFELDNVNAAASWRTFKVSEERKFGAHVCLCAQCINHLKKGRGRERKRWEDVWPVYVWKLMTHEKMISYCGQDILKLLPVEWHRFWKRALCLKFPFLFTDNIFEVYRDHVVVVKDVTRDKREFTRITEDLKLGELKSGCNKYLMPNVLCPWGCTTYLHHKGFVAFDAVIGSYFPFVEFVGQFGKAVDVNSARRDFFSDVIQMHLFNPKWSVHPSVAYLKSIGPVFLSCQEHNGGTRSHYFHLPFTGSQLPAAVPDMLSHAVLRSRTLRPMKAHKYTNTFQLQKCSGSYCGIDTCYISGQRHFDFHSHFLDISEARSYAHREDIKGLTRRLIQKDVITNDIALNLAERAKELFGGTHMARAKTLEGATMMTLKDSLSLQKMMSEVPVLEVLGDNDKMMSIKRNWPSCLIHIHPNDSYGAKIVCVPAMMQQSRRCLWIVCQALVTIPSLWSHVCDSVVTTKTWHGFLLSYIARRILNHSSKTKQSVNPFYVSANYSTKMTPSGLASLLQEYISATLNRVLVHGYTPGWFVGVFDAEIKRGVLTVVPFPSYLNETELVNACSCLTENHELIMYYRDDSVRWTAENESALPQCLHVGEYGDYELRFVCSTWDVRAERPRKKGKNEENGRDVESKWDCLVYARHGASIFRNWWAIDKLGNTHGKAKSAIKMKDWNEVRWQNCDLCVYVRKERISLEAYRRDYLKYIGGQTRVFCHHHDVPLITSFVGDKVVCCLFKETGECCTRAGYYCCPMEGCGASVCSNCFKNVSKEKSLKVVDSSRRRQSDLVHVEDEENLESNSDDSSCGVSETDFAAEKIHNVEDEYDSSSSDGSDEVSYNCVDYADTANYGDMPAFDLEQCPENDFDRFEVEDEDAYKCIVPTTHVGACVPSVDTPVVEESDFCIGSSVLLNKCGSMLVRRQSRLQASRKERNLIERVVSNPDTGTVPLIYLEGIVFPSIFFSLPHSTDGGVLGSIPVTFFCQHATRKQFGIASIAEHAKVRLTSVGNTASTDPRYLSFMFDALANGALEGQDTRVVLSRGFEESMGPAGMRMRNSEDDFYTDTIDNRQNVHNLCASEKDSASTLFITLTCNQRDHFGVAPIKRYIDDGAALENYVRFYEENFPNEKSLSPSFLREVQSSLVEASRTLTVRNWLEVKTLLLHYMYKSPEKPLGNVRKLFSRDEYQSDVGNLCHLHMLVTLDAKYDENEGRKFIQQLVQGSVDEIVGLDEVEQYIREGIIEDWEDYERMKEQARKFLPHVCGARCKVRKGPGSDELKCRVQNPIFMSGDIREFYEFMMEMSHTKCSTEILERLQLCEKLDDTGGAFVPKHAFLEAKRILPPVRRGEGNISPVIGRLFAATRSCMNVQICTSHGTSRYIVKYLIKIDENNYVAFSVNQKDPSSWKAEKVFLHNTKITSSAIHEKRRLQQSRNRKKAKGRAVSSPEQLQLLLGYPQIYSTSQFVKVPTLPLGERAGVSRKSPEDIFDEIVKKKMEEGKDITDEHDAFTFMVPTVLIRRTTFAREPHRQHTASQIMILKDQLKSRVSLDRVTIFGIRPPELLFIDKLEWYFKFFKRSDFSIAKDVLESQFSAVFNNSAWIDGLGHQVFIRPGAIESLSQLIRKQDFREISTIHGYSENLLLFDRICKLYVEGGIIPEEGHQDTTLSKATLKEWMRLQDLFVARGLVSKDMPIPVFSNVKPHNASKFVIHLLLSMGHFETERDIWMCASFRQAFVKCRLIRDVSNEDLPEEVDSLLKRWILEQLRYYPVGNKSFDDYVVKASCILKSTIIHEEVPINEVPPFFYTSLLSHNDAAIENHCKCCKEALIDATFNSLGQVYSNLKDLLPSKEQLLHATKHEPIHWEMHLPKTSRQSDESFNEQRHVQEQSMRAIDNYVSARTKAPKNQLIAGPPGAGKTHCMACAIVHSLCSGLCSTTTAILADRAFLLGGQHFHKLFRLQVRDTGSPHRLAELAVISLQKHPEFLVFLRRLDVLFVDEIGQLSAELLSTLDIIMRRIRDSSLFMGGVLIIATIDQVQLRPIKGLPFLLSPYVLTLFSMGILKHYVRCSRCVALQELNRIARFFTTDQEEQERELQVFAQLLERHCTFIESWDDPIITDEVLRVFPRKKAANEATSHFLKRKESQMKSAGKVYFKRTAEDSMIGMESHSDWEKASKGVSAYLNSNVPEPSVLHFFEGAVFQFTCNCPGKFNATQICMLVDMPKQEVINNFGNISVLVAPPGVKVINITSRSKVELLQNGWKETTVGVGHEHNVNVWQHGVKAKRRQYTIKAYVASTIHSAIGHTLSKVATSVTSGSLWERAMVVVLISRVSRACDMIFVGNKSDNIKALVDGLKTRNQYDDYMNHLVEVLVATSNSLPQPEAVHLSFHPFRPKDIPLPQDNSGVVYLIVSSVETRAIYVGYTQDMLKRLKQHNSGYGSSESSNPLYRPYALFAYVSGFEYDVRTMKRFESMWQNMIQIHRPNDPNVASDYARQLITDQFTDYNLLLVISS